MSKNVYLRVEGERKEIVLLANPHTVNGRDNLKEIVEEMIEQGLTICDKMRITHSKLPGIYRSVVTIANVTEVNDEGVCVHCIKHVHLIPFDNIIRIQAQLTYQPIFPFGGTIPNHGSVYYDREIWQDLLNKRIRFVA